jgi:hypothetical protein
MPHYRVYVLDEHGQLVGVVNFDCLDDASAKGQVGRLVDGHDVQLWRLVAELQSDDRGTDPNRINDRGRKTRTTES